VSKIGGAARWTGRGSPRAVVIDDIGLNLTVDMWSQQGGFACRSRRWNFGFMLPRLLPRGRFGEKCRFKTTRQGIEKMWRPRLKGQGSITSTA